MEQNNVLIFLGFNNMFKHKRGVENVIHFQSLASIFSTNYYLHWDSKNHIYKYGNLICIGINKNKFWFISLNIILLKLKRRNKKVFVHSHNPLMSIVSVLQTNLFTVHDGLYFLAKSVNHKFYRLFWVLEKIMYLRCKYVHFISNYTKKTSLYNTSKDFIVIPNTSHFESLKSISNKENIDEKKDKTVQILTVRSIEERALINLIIDVADKLKDENIEFVIAGKGPMLEHYRKIIKEKDLNNIQLLGYIDDQDLIQHYKACDLVLVTAAYGEGFGLPIIEGYLFNKPVIASNVCAIPDVIISNEFLFENVTNDVVSKIKLVKSNASSYEFKKYYDTYFSNEVVLSRMKKTYEMLQ